MPEEEHLLTAENTESAEMAEKLNRTTESIIGTAIEVHRIKVLKDGVRRMVNNFPDPQRSPRSQR